MADAVLALESTARVKPGDRRASLRFTMTQKVEYRVLWTTGVSRGAGEVLNISNSGIAFTTAMDLPVGACVVLSFPWPAAKNATCRLEVIVSGNVVRSSGRTTAMSIARYEFQVLGHPAQDR